MPITGHFQPLGPGTEVFNFYFLALGDEPSTITDFNGLIGVAAIQGFGTATNTMTGATTRLFFDADIRFMKGEYVGVDGQNHHGAFALI